jgi:hypothetical protein
MTDNPYEPPQTREVAHAKSPPHFATWSIATAFVLVAVAAMLAFGVIPGLMETGIIVLVAVVLVKLTGRLLSRRGRPSGVD